MALIKGMDIHSEHSDLSKKPIRGSLSYVNYRIIKKSIAFYISVILKKREL